MPVETLDHVRQVEKLAIPGVFDSDRVLSERPLDGLEFSGENRPPVVNQADRVAHHFHLFHAVRGENDGRALIAQLEHDVLDHPGVDGIQAREGFVQNENGRAMEDGGDELNFLLHAFGKVVDFLVDPLAQLQPFEPLTGSTIRLRLRQAL